MIVLDENIDADQRESLRRRRLHVQQIGRDVSRRGTQDPDIFPLLQRLSRPTFFTRDLRLHSRHLCHPRYGVVVLAVDKSEVAAFVRRVLAHPAFAQARNRMGKVVLASHDGLRYWRLHTTAEERLPWRP